MISLTPSEARKYLERWELVRQEEVRQLRAASFETKVRQLDILMASRSFLANDHDRENQVIEVRERWARIWQALHA